MITNPIQRWPYIFGSEKVHAFGYLVRETEEVLCVQRKIIFISTALWNRTTWSSLWDDGGAGSVGFNIHQHIYK